MLWLSFRLFDDNVIVARNFPGRRLGAIFGSFDSEVGGSKPTFP
jgi:hypothetical protein